MKSILSRITGLPEEILDQTEPIEKEKKEKISAENKSLSKKEEKIKEELRANEIFLNKPEADENWLIEEQEGELAVDIYEDGPNLVLKSTLAGVNPKDIDLNVEKDLITIRGKREKDKDALNKKYFNQECFWGKFSRTIILPYEINPEKVKADLKNGILTVILPKAEEEKKTKLEIK